MPARGVNADFNQGASLRRPFIAQKLIILWTVRFQSAVAVIHFTRHELFSFPVAKSDRDNARLFLALFGRILLLLSSFIRLQNTRHYRMANHILARKMNHADPFNIVQKRNRLGKAGRLTRWQINLT